ncbi:trehalase family glycosidase [Promicromonospora sp. NPDC050262]|uniref:amylo-alpha-1,6-glucosidase n=1 Tax=Promicromonospora sp. NPDC050262 TaxID=3155036 RepID=UPI0033C411BB
MSRRTTARFGAALVAGALVTVPLAAGALAADASTGAAVASTAATAGTGTTAGTSATNDGTAVAQVAGAAGTGGGGPEDDYAPRSLPFALPGFKEQEFDGALLVGEGHARFSLAFNMVTPQGRVLDDNMVPWIKRIGTVTPDGSYYEIDMTTDNRNITPETIGALRAVLAHPEDWSEAEVAKAREQLPVQEAAYEAAVRDTRTVRLRFSTTDGGEIVGSATALTDDTEVFLQASPPWSEPSTYRPEGERSIVATSAGVRDASQVGSFRLDSTETPEETTGYANVAELLKGLAGKEYAAGEGAVAQRYALDKGETVAFHAAVSTEAPERSRLSTRDVTRILDRAEARADDDTLHGRGPTGQAATYLRDAMSLNDNWDEKYDRSFVMWGLGGGGDDIFLGWDSAWDAITELSVDPATALDHIRDFYDQKGPRYDQLHAGPMHTYAAWRAYTRTGDRSILELVYPIMTRYIERMPEFDTDQDGLLESPWVEERRGGRGNHLGLDDSPQYWNYVEVPRDGGTDTRENTNLTDVALNSYYGLMAENLAQMATVLGDTAGAERYAALHERLEVRMNEHLWNEERGLYLNRYLDGSWEPTNTPTVFYPLFGGLATPERAEILVRDHLENPEEYGGEFVIPSVARNDPAFCAGRANESTEAYRYFQSPGEEDSCEEWQGAAWPPMNATVYDGLKRYGLDEAAAEVATKSTAMWLTSYKEIGWFPEYFDPEPGQVINSVATDTAWRTYSWSNLMPLMSTQELIADEPWGDADGFRFGTLGLPGTNTVSEVPLKGHAWSVTAGPRTTTLERDGRTVVRAEGGRIVARDVVLDAVRGGSSMDVTTTARTTITVTVPGARPHTFHVKKGDTHLTW